VSAMMSYH
jgi:dynein heavy chain